MSVKGRLTLPPGLSVQWPSHPNDFIIYLCHHHQNLDFKHLTLRETSLIFPGHSLQYSNSNSFWLPCVPLHQHPLFWGVGVCCAGSLLLCVGFFVSSCFRAGLGFSLVSVSKPLTAMASFVARAQALGPWLQQVWPMGSTARGHVRDIPIPGLNPCPCIAEQILNHWTSREAPSTVHLYFIYTVLKYGPTLKSIPYHALSIPLPLSPILAWVVP